MNFNIYVLNMLLFCTLCSCNKNELVPSQEDLRICHDSSNLGLSQLEEELLGEWELVMIMCYSNPKDESEASTGFRVKFKENGRLDIIEQGRVTQTNDWKIEERSTNRFELIVEPEVSELQGMIVNCNDRVEFRLSYIDLCDHRFKLIN